MCVYSFVTVPIEKMRRALFWKLTQPRRVVPYWRFGTTCLSPIQGWSSPRRIPGLLDPWRRERWFPRNVVTNYRSTLCQIPKERRSNLRRGGKLIRRNFQTQFSKIRSRGSWIVTCWHADARKVMSTFWERENRLMENTWYEVSEGWLFNVLASAVHCGHKFWKINRGLPCTL